MIRKEWRDMRAQPMSSRPALSASLISGFVCQTSLLGSRWWHLEQFGEPSRYKPKRKQQRVSPLSPRKVLTFHWLRSWVLPEPAMGPKRCCALIGLSDSHFPPLEAQSLPPSMCSRHANHQSCCVRKLDSIFTVLKAFTSNHLVSGEMGLCAAQEDQL